MSMTFAEYQRKARETAVYPRVRFYLDSDINLVGRQIEVPVYPALGLAGEVGELIRALEGRGDWKKEAGDVLWYVSELVSVAGIHVGGFSDWGHDDGKYHGDHARLASTAGRVCEHIKKAWRDRHAIDKDMIEIELGSFLNELADVVMDRGEGLPDIAEANIAKLASRKARGVIGGSGDNR